MKQIVEAEKVVKSLENLRDELLVRTAIDYTVREIVFKINSCLYKKYPVK